jgi:hypothetical protein
MGAPPLLVARALSVVVAASMAVISPLRRDLNVEPVALAIHVPLCPLA